MFDRTRDTTFFEVINPSTLGRLPHDETAKRFRVLLVYPNYSMVNLLPTNIGILAACLRQNGFQIDLFDTTFYRTAPKTLDEIRIDNLQVRKFSLEDAGVHFKTTRFVDDFRLKVETFRPDLIAVSVVEDTWPQGRTLIESVREHPATVIVGGVFPTLAPDVPIGHPDVDMICLGEGEHAIIDVSTALLEGRDPSAIQNLWVKQPDGSIVKNAIRPPIALDEVPFGDFDLFERERFFRPMQGKVVRMAPIETDRGCPYKCRFCEAPSLVGLYKEQTGHYYFRRKPWSHVREEIELYREKYGVEYIYFNAETFLAMSEKEFDEFIRMYEQIRLPFWMQTRIETLSARRVADLERVNCNRISIGLEHGNEQFRKDIVGKGFSNRQMIEAFRLLDQTSIPITVNNIIGFPGETRALVFDTIELNRELGTDSVNAFLFTPYRGTAMYGDAVAQGFLDPSAETDSPITGSVLNMPTISKDELMGLVRTFSLYVKFPREEWPEIAVAERFTPEGDLKFHELSARYYERFFDHDFKWTKKACFSTRAYAGPPPVAKQATEDITS